MFPDCSLDIVHGPGRTLISVDGIAHACLPFQIENRFLRGFAQTVNIPPLDPAPQDVAYVDTVCTQLYEILLIDHLVLFTALVRWTLSVL